MSENSELYRLLGELGADMKHVIRALETNRTETRTLRTELLEETDSLNQRLSKVETFNTRVLAYATVVVAVGVPAATALIKWGVPALIELF